MIDLYFGKLFDYSYGFGFKMVFLHESRNGELVLGTSSGGRVSLSRKEFDEQCKLNLIKEI